MVPIDLQVVEMWIPLRYSPHFHIPYYDYHNDLATVSPSQGTSLLCRKGDISTLG